MPRQNLKDLGTKKMRGLKTSMAEKKLERARQAKENLESGSPENPKVSSPKKAFVNTSKSLVDVNSAVAAVNQGPMMLHISG